MCAPARLGGGGKAGVGEGWGGPSLGGCRGWRGAEAGGVHILGRSAEAGGWGCRGWGGAEAGGEGVLPRLVTFRSKGGVAPAGWAALRAVDVPSVFLVLRKIDKTFPPQSC